MTHDNRMGEGPHATPDGRLRADELEGGCRAREQWDGRRLSYVAPPALDVAPGLESHSTFTADLDPVTYQVLRYRLWNVNLAHSDAIKRASGSPYVCRLDDFSTSVLTENGDNVLSSPTMLYFVGLADLVVKWTLENRTDNPGIADGDVFFQNDPYIGVTHQNDVAVYAPVFVDGRLFAWVYSAAHQGDVGGTQVGSWVPNARDIFWEALPWPPTVLVTRGELRRDVLEAFTRHGRSPDQAELQLRGQLAGVDAARRRLLELVDEHGPDVVKGAMRGMIRDASAAVSRRLTSLPDGTRDDTCILSIPGEFSHLARLVCRVHKHGDLLTFSNAGTDPQSDAHGVNGTYATFRSGAVVAASLLLAWDQLYCPAGVLNQLRFEPEPGTLSVARYPGAVSTQLCSVMGMHQARNVLSRILLGGPPELRARATAAARCSGATAVPMGVALDGRPSYSNMWDSLMGATGAAADGDGVDIGGAWFQPHGGGANVEEIEAGAPMLYLYRRERPDSGGPGRYRGGNGLAAATVAHKAALWMLQPVGNDPSINTIPSLPGGYPGYSGSWLGRREAGIRDAFAAGRLPRDRRELEAIVGTLDRITTKGDFVCGPDDVLVVDRDAGAGNGDPTRRDARRVLDDVARGSVTAATADHVYGVVIGADGIDEEASARRRAQIRRDRLDRSTPPRDDYGAPTATATLLRNVTDGIALVAIDGTSYWSCSECNSVLTPAAQNVRRGAALIEAPPPDLDAQLYSDPAAVFDADVAFVFRRWHCPTCGQLLAVDAAEVGDELRDDLRDDERSTATAVATGGAT